MEDEPQAKDIAYWIVFSFHILDVDHFRGHIARGSASHEEILKAICEFSQSEISNHALEVVLAAEDDVFGFEVPMHHLFAVHFLEAAEDSEDDFFGLTRLESILVLDLIIELSALQELHHDV